MKSTITQDRMRSAVSYNPNTGVFVRLHERMNRSIGKPTGSLTALGYIIIGIYGGKYYAHRLAWFWVHGEWPESLVDHIDGNKTNNKIINLRLATHGQNLSNSKVSIKNTSGFKGVVFQPESGNWIAKIKVNYDGYHLGSFKTKIEAAMAYDEAAIKYFGPFAKTNADLGLL
jgi:hypothetical protein